MGMKVNGTSGLTFPDTTTLASAGQSSVQAWVNFNGTGTVAIRASYNVSSITDNGVGDYTVNFTTAMPDADYAFVSQPRRANSNSFAFSSLKQGGLYSTTQARFVVFEDTNASIDSDITNVAIFR